MAADWVKKTVVTGSAWTMFANFSIITHWLIAEQFKYNRQLLNSFLCSLFDTIKSYFVIILYINQSKSQN